MNSGGTLDPERTEPDPVDGLVGCVIDGHPRLHLEALRWYACLTQVAGVDASDLVVHVVGTRDSEPLRYLDAAGVSIHQVDRFDERSPHCNKISAALHLADERSHGVVVLTDADTAILEDPRRMERPDYSVSAKAVDAPVPSIEVLTQIFEAADIPRPPDIALSGAPDERTIQGNCNGGLYILDAPLLPQVSSAWATWARWLLDRRELLEEWRVYVDQVAMALALASEGIAWHALDVTWNTPTHDRSRIPPDPPRPRILHYHQEVSLSGLINPTGRPSIDGQIAIANSVIAPILEAAAPRATFRRWRSETEHQGAVPADASNGIASLVASFGSPTVLEVAQPGRSVMEILPIGEHRVSPPSLDALGTSEGSLGQKADLTVALDILPYVESDSDYHRMVELLWQATSRALVVSGFADCYGPLRQGEYFHEPLRQTLSSVAPDAEFYPLAADDSSETIAVLRTPDHPHPRDFGPDTLDTLIDRVPDPVALLTMRLSARTTTGFYPDHSPRLWEYPVVARMLTEDLEPGSRLVDIGAGVSPLAPYLSSRGYVVETVDPSPIRRDWSDHQEWNEWYFLDYASAKLASRSWNCTLDQLPHRPFFDGAYSISVIEHLPAVDRRALLSSISARTRVDGIVVLTIDLHPGTDDLWNYNLAVQVDEPSEHGTLPAVIEECAAVGLELIREERVRDWPVAHVEIGLLSLRQRAPVPVSRWRIARDGVRSRGTRPSSTRRG